MAALADETPVESAPADAAELLDTDVDDVVGGIAYDGTPSQPQIVGPGPGAPS